MAAVPVAALALLNGLLLGACGSDSSGGGTDRGATPVEGDDVDRDAAADLIDDAVADTSEDARATVVIDGTTYEFKPLESPDDPYYSFCTVIAGSLQGEMQLVDDTGAEVEDGALTFVLIEPGAAYESTGDPPEISLELPTEGVAYVPTYMARGAEVDAPASGRTASGTFDGVNHLGDLHVSGTIDVSC